MIEKSLKTSSQFERVIRRYKVETELDRKLLLGVWKHKGEATKEKYQQSQKTNNNHDM